MATKVAEELLEVFTWVGLYHEILKDQGMNFMSCVFEEACKTLGIKLLRSLMYYPQTDGLVQPHIISIIRKFVTDNTWRWERLLPPVLFTVSEALQASVAFSPFKLLYEES